MQRPILLKGHERSVTHVQFNLDGDLLFSASKSYQPTVWWADNGERIGTYNGHNGAVWYLDVTGMFSISALRERSFIFGTFLLDVYLYSEALKTYDHSFLQMTAPHCSPARLIILPDSGMLKPEKRLQSCCMCTCYIFSHTHFIPFTYSFPTTELVFAAAALLQVIIDFSQSRIQL